MRKFIICFLLFIALLVLISCPDVSSADIIRYTESHEMYTQDANFIPSNEEMQEWFNIDLPRDANNDPIYTLEFNYENVDFTKEGDYVISLTFYKRADHKYQKEFKLHLKKYVPEETAVIGAIEKFYLKRLLFVSGTGIGLYIVISFVMNQAQRRYKYVLVVDNKVLKRISRKEMPSLDKIKKIIKNNKVISCITLDKVDIPVYLEEMIHFKKYDYVIEIKTK